MCQHGDTVDVYLAHEGEDTAKYRKIDRCIAPLVETLQAGGFTMVSSCCLTGQAQSTRAGLSLLLTLR